MISWAELAGQDPALAEGGRQLLYQHGPGLAFLATLRGDGAPRIHPCCPVLTDIGLYVFVIPSPKQRDLRRDGRFALHTFPPDAVDDEFTVAGRATEVTDPGVRDRVAALYREQVDDDPRLDTYVLFELVIERAMLARYRHRGDWPPTYSVWPPRP